MNEGKPKEESLVPRGASSMDIPPILMKSFFLPLFGEIESKVDELLKAAIAKGSPVDFIFMVGGFSESPFLKNHIKTKFETPNLQVLVPRRP